MCPKTREEKDLIMGDYDRFERASRMQQTFAEYLEYLKLIEEFLWESTLIMEKQ